MGKKIYQTKKSKDYKDWVINQCEDSLDSSLIERDFLYKELDEKIMLGMRLKEGVNIYKLFQEQNWNKKESENNLEKLLTEWKEFLENGLLIQRGERFYLSDPKGMDFSNQILISMFKWWDKIT